MQLHFERCEYLLVRHMVEVVCNGKDDFDSSSGMRYD